MYLKTATLVGDNEQKVAKILVKRKVLSKSQRIHFFEAGLSFTPIYLDTLF